MGTKRSTGTGNALSARDSDCHCARMCRLDKEKTCVETIDLWRVGPRQRASAIQFHHDSAVWSHGSRNKLAR